MTRSSLSSVFLAAAAAACLLFSRAAWATYVPPPLPPGTHCVSEVGWLSVVDLRKIDEEAEIARVQTGFVIDVLLAKGDEPIDYVASETFKAWKLGDLKKDNGILLVLQPNFPRGERKVRLQVGKGAQGTMTPARVNEIMRKTIGPLINGSDQVRTAVAEGVLEIAKTVGAVGVDESVTPPVDAGAARDASAPSASTSAPAGGSAPEGLGSMLWIVLGGCLVAGLGFFAFRRFGGRSKS